jgi:hypothetical protein
MILGLSLFGLSLGNLHFKDDIDIGHFLTFVTLVVGFGWWLFTTIKSWRDRGRDEARSGALRLLLKMLMDAPDQRLPLATLFETFQSPANTVQRFTYCRRRWKFDNYQRFEAAIYRLHQEGKIDFTSEKQVALRTEHVWDRWKSFVPNKDDIAAIMAAFKVALYEPADYVIGLQDVAEGAMRVAPAECGQLLRDALKNGDDRIKRRAAMLIARFVPDR